MTNLSVCEKLALEEVFECLKDRHCWQYRFANKHYFAHKMIRFYMVTRRLLHVKRS